ILSLDVPDLDLVRMSAPIRHKDSLVEIAVWQPATSRRLARYLRGRTVGPLFLTERRAKVQLPANDIDPQSGRARLSYRQAADIFKGAGGGGTLPRHRHSS